MIERKTVIANALGLHARAAAVFVHLATTFESEILVTCRDLEVDGKSIMGVMMLTAPRGEEVRIRARGLDAEVAVEKLAALVGERFGEEK